MEKINVEAIIMYEKRSYNITKDYMIPRKLIDRIDPVILRRIKTSETVIMGSTTFKELKRPLERVLNIVMCSRDGSDTARMKEHANVRVVKSVAELERLLIDLQIEDATILGGIRTFNELLRHVKRLCGRCVYTPKVFERDNAFGDRVAREFKIFEVSDFKWDKETNSIFKDVVFKRTT